MKKVGVILILSLLFIIPLILQLATIKAQETPPGLPSELNQNPDEILEKIKNQTFSKWDYLAREWRATLLKNKYIASADSFFTKYSIVFNIIFNMPYSLSITLFVIFLLWIFVAFESGRWLQKLLGIKEAILALLIGAGVSIILAHIGILLFIVKVLGILVYAKDKWWWNLIMIVVIILFFVALALFGEQFAKWLDEREKKKMEKKTEQKQKETIAFAEGLEKGAGI